MILLALLGAVTAPTPPSITFQDLNAACISGINGNEQQMQVCTSVIKAHARALEPEGGSEESTCMSVPQVSSDEIIWSYIDWAGAHDYTKDADAGPSVLTALLDAYPCGWVEI